MRYSGRRCVYYIIFINMCGDRRPDYSPKLARVLKLHPYYDINNIKNYNNNNVKCTRVKDAKEGRQSHACIAEWWEKVLHAR